MPEEIVQATIDYDHPRVVPSPVQSLSDIVYVSNITSARTLK